MKQAIIILALFVSLLVAPAPQVQANPLDFERDPDFIAGRAALDDGFYDIAAKRFEEYINKTIAKRRKAYGSIFMFRAWYGTGEYEKIIDWLRENWKLSNGTRYEAGYFFWYAQAKFALGLHADTLEYLKGFESRFPDDEFLPYVIRLRALALRDSRKLEAAEAMFARFDKQFRDSEEMPDNLLDWAGVLIQLKRGDEGRRKLQRLVEVYPDSPVARRGRLWLGQWAMENGEIQESTDWLFPLTADAGADPSIRADAWFVLARAAVEQGNITNALDALVQGEQLTTNVDRRVEARIDQARLLMGQNRLVEAVQIMDQTVFTLALHPQAARAQLELSDLLRAQGQFEKALNAYQRYLESFSDDSGQRHALYAKAWCLWELQRYTEAALAFEKAFAVQRNPELREQALLKTADSYFMNGQYRLAASSYEKAIEEFSSSRRIPETMYQAAESYARTGDASNTVRMIDLLVQTYPQHESARNGLLRLASFHESQRSWDDAVSAYETSMNMYPDDDRFPEALLGRAMLKYRRGDYQDAMNSFDRLLNEFPETQAAEQSYFMRAWCYYQMGEVPQALEIGREFVRERTNSAWRVDVSFWLSEHEFNRQNYGAAETNFAAIAQQYPTSHVSDRALYWAGRATIEQKAFRRAIDYFNQLIRTYTNSPLIPDVRFAQGDALTEIGDFAGAILAFDEILLKYPGHPLFPRAMGRIGDCQFSLGSERPERYQEAAATFRSLLSLPQITRDLAIQAEYKLARTYERLGRTDDAFTHYLNVMYGWLAAREQGDLFDEVWLVRSAFSAAAIKENEQAWDEALKVYNRIIESGITAAVDAGIRKDRIATQRQKNDSKTNSDIRARP